MKVEKLLPEIYYKESRDFAYAGRLLDLVVNYMKMNCDGVGSNPDTEFVDTNIANLVANSLGFESKHKYTTRDLVYVVSSFTELLRYKGTVAAIENAIKLLINSQKLGGTLNRSFVMLDPSDPCKININIPEDMTDVILLEDLFDYILPAGVVYQFTIISQNTISTSVIKDSNRIKIDKGLPEDYKGVPSTDLGTLYETGMEKATRPETISSDLAFGTIGTGVIAGPDLEEE